MSKMFMMETREGNFQLMFGDPEKPDNAEAVMEVTTYPMFEGETYSICVNTTHGVGMRGIFDPGARHLAIEPGMFAAAVMGRE